ncbi:MAG: 3-hydroxybutyryl-CoA dehydrogenase [Alphaproteobacteria bacterium]|nr:3-hydroxybutyryl-CoA dehydrogenase [Alphaproteobacteria bacterium]
MSNMTAVIGAGQMGSGIAQVFATAGFKVSIYDISPKILDKSKVRIERSLARLAEKGHLEEPVEAIINRVKFVEKMDDLADSQIFIESAFENFDIKTNILYKLAQYLSEDSYVASNTSSLSITSLSQMLPYPDKFIGFHFMNPPPIMQLVEVIRGYHTSDETYNYFWNLAKQLGKYPIYSKNAPGFVLNRVLIPMINEAIYALYENISTAEHIDEALKLGANHPIGPLALADLIGLDTVLAILKTLQKELGERNKYRPCPLLEEYVEKGFLGRKSKKGFYEYDDIAMISRKVTRKDR